MEPCTSEPTTGESTHFDNMTQTNLNRNAVLKVLKSHGPRALHLGEICGRLRVPGKEKEEVLRNLLLLVDEGFAREMPGLRFRIVDRSSGKRNRGRKRAPQKAPEETYPGVALAEGELIMTARGFGFVSTDDDGSDVFIPPDATGPALHGDRVQVRTRPSPKGREGRIVGIVRRRSPRITGLIRKAGRQALLEPDDERLRSPMRIRGKVPREAGTGKTVLAEIVAYPQTSEDRVEVSIVEVLGKHGAAQVEVEKIKIREGIVEGFSDEVQAEMAKLPSRVSQKEIRAREDLRELDLVTIDPETAKDHDDALWARRHRDGGFRILVAIADVSHYVTEDSLVDYEAFNRGTSIYLPDRAIPMLPPELSSNLASLIPQHDRLCLAVDMELDARGRVTSHRFVEGIMRSHARLTYEGAARALGLSKRAKKQPAAEKRQRMLKTLADAARLLRARRVKRGALDFDLPEPKVVLHDDNREPVSIIRSREDPGVREAYRLVEEMMLLANEVVASELKKRSTPALYRVHGKPDPEKMETFCRLAESLGYDIDVEAASDSKRLARFLHRIEGTPQASMLRYLLLRAMQQAIYDTDPTIGHFGLATSDYTHFTSPIRRYPDLVVHRMIRKVIHGKSIDAAMWEPRLKRIGAEASRLERKAMSVERDVLKVYRAIFMQDRIGDEFTAKVSGFSQNGIYATLDEPFIDAILPFEQLDDHFRPDDLGIRLIGERSAQVFTLGDPLRVRIEDVSIADRQVIASIISHEQLEKPRADRRKQKVAKKAKAKPKKRSQKKGRRSGGGQRRRSRKR